ncbi:unnamed protein product, partial [Porites evermanni]
SPQFLSTPYTVNIGENLPVGTTVIKVVASDQDPSDSLTYSLSGTNNNHFSIGSSTGVISTAQTLDRENINSYSLTLSVSDGSVTVTEAISIGVDNANDPPTFSNAPFNVSVDENVNSGNLLTVSATDDDGDAISFSIYGVGSELFSVHSSSGVVSLAGALDYETVSGYTLTIRASDANGGVATTSLYVDVVNQNDDPTFLGTPYSSKVDENLVSGSTVLKLTATDQDASDSLSYSIAGTNSGHFAVSSFFSIHLTSGVVALTTVLDYEVTSLYTLTVRVSDSNGGVVTTSLTVTVSDANDSPQFLGIPYSATVSENLPIATDVIKISAFDADGGDSLSYSLSGTNSGHFQISSSSGLVETTQVLDYETVNYYSLTVSVSDGSVSISTSLTISVSNTNDAPYVTNLPGNVSIAENDVTAAVIDVNASDPDGDNITFSLSGTGSDDFRINSATGLVTLNRALNYEIQELYSLTVRVSDGAGGVAFASLTVITVNQNDPPVILGGPYTAKVEERSLLLHIHSS